jgi:hypothetical protein
MFGGLRVVNRIGQDDAIGGDCSTLSQVGDTFVKIAKGHTRQACSGGNCLFANAVLC